MKMKEERRWADPEAAARRIMDIARAFEPIQDGRIYIEKINYPFIDKDGATPAEYGAGIQFCLDRLWLMRHESGTYVKILPAGNDAFA
ncbi:hypothetical protein [Bradyrhizobium sp. 2S1]|uniref:hypothetical protein n=1 Tax=Bradyrhizobium sp. 2S1 TaxID=1404429 RepID=UPI00140854D2|nr:hypothetical protein [Bradyrhizobium sp. 2S1]MCK7670147.1 hypothetical protein [Bradyrhizobium sp. 2S1]